MLRVRPFNALLPPPNRAAQVAAPPYDTLSTDEARAQVEGRPLSFLRITRAEVELPEATASDDPATHRRARANLDRMVAEGALRPEPEPQIVLYRQVMHGHRQVGVVACCDVDDYERGTIIRHERTRPDKERERTDHLLACEAHTEPVFLGHRDDFELEDLVRRDMNDRPRFHFVAVDGTTHTIWSVSEPERYAALLSALPAAYICDGHHRVAAAALAARERRARGIDDGTGHDRFLAVFFPLSHLKIMAYHRLVRTLGGMTPDQFRRRLECAGHVQPAPSPEPGRQGEVGVFLGDRWWLLSLDPAASFTSDVAESLDVSALQRLVLAPLLGIEDPRRDARLDFVGGIRGAPYLEECVRSGRAAAAFAMYPTSIRELLAVADSGGVMPPKSTWFEPKLRSGLFVHPWRR
ncbi:MAG TPA: DUF1015 family protein [Phycisphaerales bacterium]|nr:DUF1015 family protein [Phycisphaerales bacterium]HMP36607.1 DUF1015 family protein [Phycisphaerales bacterium]